LLNLLHVASLHRSAVTPNLKQCIRRALTYKRQVSQRRSSGHGGYTAVGLNR
jgi:hypothetical protein